MKLSDFEELLTTFSSKPRPGRHVYLWHGKKEILESKVPSEIIHHLEILASVESMESPPAATSEAGEQLRKEIIRRLQNLRSEFRTPQILMVTGCHLLARYKIGIGIFFQHYVGDGTMVIFAIPKESQSIPNLPSYVEFEPETTFQYLASLIGERSIIGEEDDEADSTNSHRQAY